MSGEAPARSRHMAKIDHHGRADERCATGERLCVDCLGEAATMSGSSTPVDALEPGGWAHREEHFHSWHCEV
jgi:hypothetical protein